VLAIFVAGSVISGDVKEEAALVWQQVRSTDKSAPVNENPAAQNKLEEQQKWEAAQAAEVEEPVYKTFYSSRNNTKGAASIAGHAKANYDSRMVYFTEDFEDLDNFPPIGWDSINTDPGYGFFPGTYSGGGTRAALVTWHGPGFQQDEWMISPSADLSAAGSDIRLEFWFLKGYDYPHEFKVYVATDGSTFNLVWDSDVEGAGYPAFTWTQATVDMSAFIGEASVTVGFQYYGVDADLFGLDDVTLTDDAPATGRCCSGDIFDPTCTEGVTFEECSAMGGSWVSGGNCTDNPCPVPGEDDNCADVTPEALPFTFVGNNEAATLDTYCQYFGEYPNSWLAFTISECTNITLSYCGTQAGWGNGWLNLITDCACGEGSLISGATYDFNCPNGNPNIYWSHLPAGTYYYPVMLDPANGASGDWSIEVTGETCPPPPANDACDGAEEIGDVVGMPFSTTDATLDGAGYSGGPNIWYCYTATCDGQVTVSLCGSSYDTKVAAFEGCTCDPLGALVASNDDACGLSSEIKFMATVGQQFLIEVGSYSSTGGDGLLSISCEVVSIEPGDVCADPLKIDLPPLPYSDLGQTTCGRGDDYETTCLGVYDGGEDIIYEITVISEVTVDITLDPLGTTYTGFVVDDVCPPGAAGCIAQSASSGSAAHGVTSLVLSAGTYYLMVDTWPAPDCIPSFDLHITEGAAPPPAPANDNWADAEEVGDVTDHEFCNESATFDGPGDCNDCGNVWYCYTASCNGNVLVDVCNSDYDTKLGVYNGCGEPTTATLIACNDDACGSDGYKSQLEFAAVAGNTYLIEIGGYNYSSTGCDEGCGLLSISCSLPCQVECPSGAIDEGEPCGDDTNGGCNSPVPVFTDISCGQTVCGNAWFDGSTRDTDWYRLTLDGYYEVTWTVQSEFDALIGPVGSNNPGSGNCADATGSIDPAAFPLECETGSVTALLGPGVHFLFVAPQFTSVINCAAGPWDYWASVTCVPAGAEYCDASTNFCDEYISNVTVADINNSSSCTNYSDYTGITGHMDIGTAYPISVSNGFPYSSDQCGIWVDWNQDLDFDDADETIAVSGTPGNGPYTGSITPPAGALEGNTRMRVRITYTGAVLPCGTTTYGEVEDYTIAVSTGAVSEQLVLDPDPIRAAMARPLDPQCVHIYLGGDFAPGYDVNDINLASLLVNSSLPAVQTEVLSSYPDFTGPVLDICVDMATFVRSYGVLYNTTTQSYCVEGAMGDATPFSLCDDFSYVGHISGDVNLDGSVNILDLSYLINYIFRQGPTPQDPVEADINADSNSANILDLNYMINFIFRQGPPPLHLDQN
jgi:hypothetical protein